VFFLTYAWKSLVQRRRQYISLFSVCTLSVCVIISLLSIFDGMLNALNAKSIQFYGGELQVICGNRWLIEYSDSKKNIIEESLQEMNIKGDVFKRFDLDGSNSQLYFEGANTFCRILKGVDFAAEKKLFENCTFTEGDAINASGDCILISKPVAEKLGCHAGDFITLMMKTLNGYTNTRKYVVKGIFQDSSLFGMYTSYIDIDSLRDISEYPEDFVNRLSIYNPNYRFSRKDINKLQGLLSKNLNMAPIPKQKEVIGDESSNFNEALYALITLDANRPEVVMMSNALQLILYLMIVPLVLIVAIGIGCSYRVVILKRIVETSTFRALGLKSGGIERLFFTEVFLILLVGFVLGTGLSFAVTSIIGQFNFSFIPAFDLFLIGGRIKADYSFWKTVFILVIISVSTLICVFVTLRNIIHLSPAKAFATTA